MIYTVTFSVSFFSSHEPFSSEREKINSNFVGYKSFVRANATVLLCGTLRPHSTLCSLFRLNARCSRECVVFLGRVFITTKNNLQTKINFNILLFLIWMFPLSVLFRKEECGYLLPTSERRESKKSFYKLYEFYFAMYSGDCNEHKECRRVFYMRINIELGIKRATTKCRMRWHRIVRCGYLFFVFSIFCLVFVSTWTFRSFHLLAKSKIVFM